MPPEPRVAVVIPSGDSSRSRNLQKLLDDLQQQSRRPDETQVVHGVSPNGHARNVGTAQTTAEVLVYLDDDVRLGSPQVLQTLVDVLFQHPDVGLVGTAQQLPTDSSAFQRACAAQISRSQSDVVRTLTDSDMVTTQCCAIRRDVLEKVGGFRDRILRGVDPELRERIRRHGYRIVVAPDVWHYHPMPATLTALLRMAWRNGHASAFAARHFPETLVVSPEGHARATVRLPLWRRVLGNLQRLLATLLRGQWYGLLYLAAYGLGWLAGAAKTVDGR